MFPSPHAGAIAYKTRHLKKGLGQGPADGGGHQGEGEAVQKAVLIDVVWRQNSPAAARLWDKQEGLNTVAQAAMGAVARQQAQVQTIGQYIEHREGVVHGLRDLFATYEGEMAKRVEAAKQGKTPSMDALRRRVFGQ